jgi:hypothetical protein
MFSARNQDAFLRPRLLMGERLNRSVFGRSRCTPTDTFALMRLITRLAAARAVASFTVPRSHGQTELSGPALTSFNNFSISASRGLTFRGALVRGVRSVSMLKGLPTLMTLYLVNPSTSFNDDACSTEAR